MNRALALGVYVFAAACGTSERTAPAPLPVPAPRVPDAATSPPVDASVASGPVPDASRQLVTAVVDRWDGTTATLRRYRRAPNQPWVADGPAWAGVVGSGAAWGAGLHGDGPPTGRRGARKAEGDGRSPAGVFALVRTYGYADTEPTRADADAGLAYRTSTPALQCVDDAASTHYNQIVERTRDTESAWTSSERMRRTDELYRWVVEVAHNAAATPRGGSCIFLHVWRDAASPTVGCTAMPEPALRSLIGWLVRADQPTFVLLPRSEYIGLAPAWGLPPLGT